MDLISRDAAIDALIERDPNCGIDSAEVIKDLPSAQPERKTGKWLWQDGVRCSNCNHKLQTTGLLSCCPNCGSYNGG